MILNRMSTSVLEPLSVGRYCALTGLAEFGALSSKAALLAGSRPLRAYPSL